MKEPLGSLVSIEPAKLVSAVGPNQIEGPQFPCFGHTPRVHLFAAHTVLEMLLPFEDEDSNSTLRNGSGDGRACQPASDNDDIVREHASEISPLCPYQPRSDQHLDDPRPGLFDRDLRRHLILSLRFSPFSTFEVMARDEEAGREGPDGEHPQRKDAH